MEITLIYLNSVVYLFQAIMLQYLYQNCIPVHFIGIFMTNYKISPKIPDNFVPHR